MNMQSSVPLKRHYSVVIVGGGIAGMSALWHLRDRDAVLFESADLVGGRTRSLQIGPYWANLGAHRLAGPTSPMGQLAKSVGVDLVPIPGSMFGVWQNGKMVSGGRLESYPFRLPLSLSARLSMIRSGLRLAALSRTMARYVTDAMHGERSVAGEFATVEHDRNLDRIDFAKAMGPMHPDIYDFFRTATHRLGSEFEEMSAAFGAANIGGKVRNQNFQSWAMKGGTDEVCKLIAQKCHDKIHLSSPITRIEVKEDHCKLQIITPHGKQSITADYVVSAVPAFNVIDIVSKLPDSKRRALGTIKYGPYLVMVAETAESVPMNYDDLYAVSVVGRTICQIYNPLNPQRPLHSQRQPGGIITMYSAANKARALLDLEDREIRDRYLSDLYTVFPKTKGLIRNTHVQRWPHGYPFWQPGRLELQTEIARPYGRLFFAGDYVEYPSTDPAAHSGLTAASAIKRQLDASERVRVAN